MLVGLLIACRGGRAALAIHHCRKPTIGAINGSAVGVGITMCLPMTIRIAYASAKIGFVFARRGLVMEATSSFYLPRLIGYSRALQAVTTGMTYKASDKVYDGLFAELCDKPEDVLPKALEMAQEVVRNTSVVSTYLMREMMYRNAGSPEGQHLLDSRIIYELFGSPYVFDHWGWWVCRMLTWIVGIIPRGSSRSWRRGLPSLRVRWILQR